MLQVDADQTELDRFSVALSYQDYLPGEDLLRAFLVQNPESDFFLIGSFQGRGHALSVNKQLPVGLGNTAGLNGHGGRIPGAGIQEVP